MNAHQFSALAALQGKQTSQQCSLVGEADKPAQQQCSGCGHFCISLPRDASAAIPGAQSDFPPHDVAAVFMSPGFRAALLRARAQRKFYFCKEKKKERERSKKKKQSGAHPGSASQAVPAGSRLFTPVRGTRSEAAELSRRNRIRCSQPGGRGSSAIALQEVPAALPLLRGAPRSAAEHWKDLNCFVLDFFFGVCFCCVFFFFFPFNLRKRSAVSSHAPTLSPSSTECRS